MKIEKITEGFEFLPTISLNWYWWKDKKHYYLTISWLFWYFTTLKKFEWE